MAEKLSLPRLLKMFNLKASWDKLACWLGVCLLLTPCLRADSASVSRDAELAARKQLVTTILAPEESQEALMHGLPSAPQKVLHDLLTSWMREEIYLYQPPMVSAAENGVPITPAPPLSAVPPVPPVPVTLEETQDGSGKSRAILVSDGSFLVDAQGQVLRYAAGDLPSVSVDMRLRGGIQQALNILALSDPDPNVRQAAVMRLGMSQKPEYEGPLRACLAKEQRTQIRRTLLQSLALIAIKNGTTDGRLAGIRDLESLEAIGSLDSLKRIATDSSQDPKITQAANVAMAKINQHIKIVNFFGTIFRGISLGMVLLIVALGLAITFGLMGVINMAHGEMIAVGAYTCYVIENLFTTGFAFSINLPFSFFGHQLGFGLHLPGLHASGWFYQCYFLIAIPMSFLIAALVGLLVERLVIRFLYSRPLESLLATWGVSLFLQQCFRLVFGANNVQVNSPSWLLGNVTVNDISFDYNRIFVIFFAVLIVFGTWFLLTKTPLGLLIRAVTQNRNMAACVGVRTEWVNVMTFAFGSGLAGLAGAFLSQIGNVGPSLGQSYIVDSFMTVVVGGVGNIFGTVCSALGVGVSDQILQQLLDSPVMGKILVLGAIILFLQWKPGGLFPSRSRSLDE